MLRQNFGWSLPDGEREAVQAREEAVRAEHLAKLVRQLDEVLKPGRRVREQFTISDVLWLSREIAVSQHRAPLEIGDLQARVIQSWLDLQ